MSIASNLHQRLFIQRIKNIEFLGCIPLKVKADAGCKEDGNKDTNGLYEILLNESQR